MYGVDTNVLLRYIVRDDPAQAQAATQLLETHCTAESPGWINLIVLCECIWVLRRGYRFAEERIADWVGELLVRPDLAVEAEETVRRALRRYAEHSVGLADCLIAEINAARGTETTFTFDRKAARLPGFTLLGT